MFKQLNPFYRFFFIILLIYGEAVGIYHTMAEHKEKNHVMASIVIPPYAWYRSLEIWWHKDIDKELQMDMVSCAYFFMSGGDSESLYKFNEELNEFAKIISKYSSNRKEILENFSKLYIKYRVVLAQDINVYLKNWNKSKHFKDSKNITSIENELSTFLPEEDMKLIKIGKQATIKNTLEGLNEFKDEEFNYEKWKEDFDSTIETYLIFSKRTYKVLFDKEYIE